MQMYVHVYTQTCSCIYVCIYINMYMYTHMHAAFVASPVVVQKLSETNVFANPWSPFASVEHGDGAETLAHSAEGSAVRAQLFRKSGINT